MTTEFQPDPSPAHVRELALACVQYVQRAPSLHGAVLDFQPETLPILDHYLQSVRGGGDDVRALVAPAAGAYFGEVVRRCYPARWFAPADDCSVWRIEFEMVFLHFNPIAFAHEAVEGREIVEGGAGFGVDRGEIETLRAALDVLGTVNEEDYFRLATRFEVLAAVVDRLVADATERGEPALNLGPGVYQTALDGDAEMA